MKFIPYGKQWIDEDDIKSVVDVLRGDWLTQGPMVGDFERSLADYCGAKYAVAVSSGTAALHIACLAAGIREGDEAITSPITFVASANCVLYCGGRPVFADIDPATYNIDPEEIKKKLTPRTRALIPVHFAGLPCEMEEIKRIADEHRLLIIEDACHALGAEWQDIKGKWNRVGSCSHSDMTVFSFHPVKHITTGEGGAILTNRKDLYEKLLVLRTHGITKDPEVFVNKGSAYSSPPANARPAAEVNPWYYEMQELGFNYRLTDIQCALGNSQLKKIDAFVSRRREIAARYNEAFQNIKNIRIPSEPDTKRSSCHLYPLQVDFEKLGKTRTAVMNDLRDRGVGTQVHYIPVHLQPYYRKYAGCKEGDHPVSESFYQHELSLPLYPSMMDTEIDSVIKNVRECMHVQ